jgi:hypothetical protein
LRRKRISFRHVRHPRLIEPSRGYTGDSQSAKYSAPPKVSTKCPSIEPDRLQVHARTTIPGAPANDATDINILLDDNVE